MGRFIGAPADSSHLDQSEPNLAEDPGDEVNDGKHIVDQLLNRVVAPELLREVGTHVGPFCKWQGANTDDLPNQGVRIEKARLVGTLSTPLPCSRRNGGGYASGCHRGHCCGSYSPHCLCLRMSSGSEGSPSCRVVALENIIHTFGGCFARGPPLRFRNVRPLQASAISRTSSVCPSGQRVRPDAVHCCGVP